MPRRTRQQLVGEAEQEDQRRRERELRLLEQELHRQWQTAAVDSPPQAA